MRTFIIFPLVIASATLAESAIIVINDMDLTTSTAGGAGATLDMGAPFQYTIHGVTFTASATTNFGDGTAVFNATGTQAGVNTGGGGASIGDNASQIDPGETLTFTLGLASHVTQVRITDIDYAGVGDATDSSTTEYPDGAGGTATITLVDGSTNFSGGDVWTPPGGITFEDGDQITFSNTASGFYRLQNLSIEITTIPEPSGVLLTALGAGLLGFRRKR